MLVTIMAKPTSLVCRKLDFSGLTPNLVFSTGNRRKHRQRPIPQIIIIRIISVTDRVILSSDLMVGEVVFGC